MNPIIYLSPVSYFKGGAERSLFDLVSNPNITPILAVPAEGPIQDKAQALGISCHIIPFGSIHNIHRPFSFVKGLTAFSDLLKAAHALKKLAKSKNVLIVHSNGLKAHAINCVSRWIGGPKAILHIRDIPYTKAEKIVWKVLYHMANRMILVSKACWPDSIIPPKASVIHNGTPLIPFVKKDAAQKNIIRLGFIGRIHPAKGLHLLLNWMKSAQEKKLFCQLSVRGSFSEDAPTYQKEIQDIITHHALQDKVTFEGFIDNAEEVYKDLDCVVVPSDTPDPLPRSVMESMARGIPVLGYPAGGIPDMIDNGITGFLVADKMGFIQALEKLTNDSLLLSNMTAAAHKKIETDFSIPNLHSSLNKIYREI